MFKLKHMYKFACRFFVFCLPAFVLLTQNSCKKEYKYEAQVLPKILSVTPVAGIVGTQVTVKGSNLKSVNKVRFGTVDAAGFNASSNTDSTVTVVVPNGLDPGELQLQVYYPDGAAYSSIKFTVLETPRPPTINSVSPTQAYPGDEVTINGADFITVTEVKFGAINSDFTINGTAIKTTVPLNAAGGAQLITVTNPVGSATVNFTVDLSPVITALSPGSGGIGDSITIKGKRLNNITSVKLGSLTAGFVSYNDSTVKFEVPVGASSGNVTITNSIGTGTSPGPFNVTGLVDILEPVQDQNLVFFDFNGTGKDSWWGDIGGVENEPSLAISGPYFRVNTAVPISGWNGFFWRNGGNNFPGSIIGTNISDYVLKFDIYVIDPITGGEFAWRLKGTQGDFWYSWQPWTANGGTFRTFGWKTFTIPLTEFVDGGGNHITDLSTIDSDFGVAFNNGTSMVNVAIDNVRFHHQ